MARGLLARWPGPSLHLDGDELRAGLCRDLGFGQADREENVRRVAEVARLGALQGLLVVVSLISPLRAQRAMAAKIVGDGFLEVYVRCSLEEAARRDPKGLYARAMRGEIAHFTGLSSDYEPPEDPALIVDTEAMGVPEAVLAVEKLVAERAEP